MPIKVTLGQIADSFNVLSELYALKLRFNLKYRLGRIRTECEPIAKQFHEDHVELIRRFGGRIEDVNKGGVIVKEWRVPAENMPDFQPEYDQLAAVEVELHHNRINPSEFETAESVNCAKCGHLIGKDSPEIRGDITKLFWLICDPMDSSETQADQLPESSEEKPAVN